MKKKDNDQNKVGNIRNKRFVFQQGDFEYLSPEDLAAGKRPKPPRIPKIRSKQSISQFELKIKTYNIDK